MGKPFVGLRSVLRVLDNQGVDVDNQRGITPHTWANWREKEPDEATSVSKENMRKHTFATRKNLHESKTSHDQNVDFLSCK